MAEGICLNEDCEKESWVLTKRLEEYSGSGPQCPTCGTTRVEIVQPGVPTQPQQHQQQTTQQAMPTPVQPQHGGQLQAANGPGSGAERFAIEAARALDSSQPVSQRKESVKGLAEVFGGGIAGIMEFNEQKRKMEEQRARQSSLEPVSDKPMCATDGCSYTFGRIPQNVNRVVCPECGLEHAVVD